MRTSPTTASLVALLLALSLAVVLIGVTGWGWWQIRAERPSLAVAEASQLSGRLLPCARFTPLAECLAGLDGVRWVQLDDSPSFGPQVFGTDLFPSVRLTRGETARMLPDGYVRARAPLPPRDAAPRDAPPRDGPPPDGPPGERPAIQFDFVPLFADRLEAQARSSFGLGASVGVGFFGAAWALYRQRARTQRAEADAERNREMAAMGTMSAVLAHEIRNPVAAMLGNAQLLAEELDNEQVRHVLAGAQRLRTLTEQLLTFSRTGDVQRCPTDPRVPALAALAGRGVLLADHAPTTWSLDPDRTEQLLNDLIDNAPTPVELGIHLDGDLVYTVRDHGPGLPPGDPERLFTAFFTTRSRGTGLGLAVVRRLVEAHGGSVVADNHPEGGARFTVRIPGSR